MAQNGSPWQDPAGTASPGGPRFGVDLGGTKIEVIALDGAGTCRLRRRVPTPRDDYPATIRAVADLIAAAERELGVRGRVGVGIPGAISPASGLVKNANSTWLIGRPLDRDLAAALNRPVRLANDADCFALSEASDGAGAGAASVFGVILGTGVGGGVVVGGRPLAGPNAIAGEWGHNPLPWPADHERPGPACYCGRHGCLETFLSGPGLAADHARAGGTETDPKAIVAAAHEGCAVAQATLDRHADRLARGLASVINLLDPAVIVLGGGLSGLAHLYDELPRRLPAYVFSDTVTTPIRPPVHGDSSGVRGAAWLWPSGDQGR
ncbi:ROK family protein [Roseospirillum parvum]|uniref:Fructokinase n=1 Tax=Roseospirillum parvum TaxID=83401 RepID=A0A1G7UNZ7_9PROT|nr:ROK family protein [Roseospirillum parvum]SDG48839.1 fructokinase [Roseospirillum parvum]